MRIQAILGICDYDSNLTQCAFKTCDCDSNLSQYVFESQSQYTVLLPQKQLKIF